MLSVEEEEARYQASKSAALSRLERGELWPVEDKVHSRICPEMRKDDCLLQENLQNQSCPKRMEQCHEHNALGNVYQSKNHCPLWQNHDILYLHGKTLKSNLSSISQNRNYEVKNPVKANVNGKFFLHAKHEEFHSERNRISAVVSQQTRMPSIRQKRKDGGPQGAEAAVVARTYELIRKCRKRPIVHHRNAVKTPLTLDGYRVSKSDVLFKLEQGEERWMTEDEIHSHTWPETGNIGNHLQVDWENKKMLKGIEQYQERNTFGNPVLQSQSYFCFRQNHDMFEFYIKTLKSNSSLVIQSQSYEIKNSTKCNGDGKSFLFGKHEKCHSPVKCPGKKKRTFAIQYCGSIQYPTAWMDSGQIFYNKESDMRAPPTRSSDPFYYLSFCEPTHAAMAGSQPLIPETDQSESQNGLPRVLWTTCSTHLSEFDISVSTEWLVIPCNQEVKAFRVPGMISISSHGLSRQKRRGGAPRSSADNLNQQVGVPRDCESVGRESGLQHSVAASGVWTGLGSESEEIIDRRSDSVRVWIALLVGLRDCELCGVCSELILILAVKFHGYQGTKPDMLSKLEHGREPCIIENEMRNRICPGIRKGDSYLPEHSRNQRFLKSMQQCSEQNAFRKSVHLSKTHFTLIQDRIFNLHRKALESSLSLINQKSSYGIKNPVEFNGDEKSFLHSDCGQLYSGIIFPESFQASTPEVLSKLDQGEPWMMDDETHCQTRSEVWKFDDHLLEYLQNESMEKRLEQWHEQNPLENAVHQSITHFLLRQHHDVFDLHDKCMKSNLTLLSQNLSYEIKSSNELIGDEKSCRHADSIPSFWGTNASLGILYVRCANMAAPKGPRTYRKSGLSAYTPQIHLGFRRQFWRSKQFAEARRCLGGWVIEDFVPSGPMRLLPEGRGGG
ncbi:hypothetical protein E5288_WYG021855 [Bos mutus]|uniref:Uncharacterized protein n=1 Tax=Bos mutus TaxID=72004 RepID=A0A6B0S9S2_9CETA|nr:hypothetical protein [Bos mutus]